MDNVKFTFTFLTIADEKSTLIIALDGQCMCMIICGKNQPECLETNNPIDENYRGWANGYAWLVEDAGQLEKVIDYSRPRYYFLKEEGTHDILERVQAKHQIRHSRIGKSGTKHKDMLMTTEVR